VPPECTNSVTGEPVEANGNEMATVGVITGDVLFDGIADKLTFCRADCLCFGRACELS